jgi:hypothetical protein
MLSFDIETEGLDASIHRITVAAVYDADRGISRVHNLLRDGDAASQAFMRDLDDADSLCSFNGVKFDIKFIVARLHPPAARYEAWILKDTDIYEMYRTVLNSTASLNTVLLANNYEPKTGSGLQAIEWARNQQWELLESYCLDDARLTWEVSSRPLTTLPLKARTHVGSDHLEHTGAVVTMSRRTTISGSLEVGFASDLIIEVC